MESGRLDKEWITSQLRTKRVQPTIEIIDELESTNRYILDLLQSRPRDGTVVLAEHQSAGRGRQGRSWHCPRGAGILCTVGLCDRDRAIDANLLSLVVPIALCDGLHAVTDVPCGIKWPNDIVVGTRKLGGVLIESCPPGVHYAVGFGINCLQHRNHFPPELRETSTSLDLESKRPVDRAGVLVAVLTALDSWVASPQRWQKSDICRQWKERAAGFGGRVRLEHEGRFFDGNLLDIDPTAAIVVQLDEGGRRLFSASSTTIVAQGT